MTRRSDVVDSCSQQLRRPTIAYVLAAVIALDARRQHSKPLSQHSLRLCRTDRRQVIPPIFAQ